MLKIHFVSVENGIIATGFRKMVSLAKSIHPETKAYYIPLTSHFNPLNLLFKSGVVDNNISKKDLGIISEELSKADMVCFSSMTELAELTKEIISAIRERNPKAYISWGGIHPIVYPDDAIKNADAICTGEGEVAFQNFLSAYQNGVIIKNGFYHCIRLRFLTNSLFPYLLKKN